MAGLRPLLANRRRQMIEIGPSQRRRNFGSLRSAKNGSHSPAARSSVRAPIKIAGLHQQNQSVRLRRAFSAARQKTSSARRTLCADAAVCVQHRREMI